MIPQSVHPHRWLFGLLVGLLLASLICTPAWAEGGTSIAGAPAVTYGQQEFGSLTQGTEDSGHCISVYRSWWTLPVIAGDSVTIDWEAQYRFDHLELYAPGTTDFTYPQASVVATSLLNENAKASLTYDTPQGGSLPLGFVGYNDFFCDIVPGPYSFTAYVVHTVRVFIARRGSLPLRGTLPVAVHDPVGEPVTDPNLQVTLEVKARGHWHTVGQAAVSNAIANVPFSLSARLHHLHVSLRAIARGSAYHSASSAAIRVRVA